MAHRPDAEERFLKKCPNITKEWYEDIKKKIRKLDEGGILCVPRLRYVAFKPNHKTRRNFVHLHLEDKTFEFYLRLECKEIDNIDITNITCKKVQHSGKYLRCIVKNNESIPDGMMDLIEKSRKKLLGNLLSD